MIRKFQAIQKNQKPIGSQVSVYTQMRQYSKVNMIKIRVMTFPPMSTTHMSTWVKVNDKYA
jgi:hypothetical protein